VEFIVEGNTADAGFLNACRKKRNTSVYEEIGMVSEGEAAELIAFAERWRRVVLNWLRKSHPSLM
jgi:hypothetical protein